MVCLLSDLGGLRSMIEPTRKANVRVRILRPSEVKALTELRCHEPEASIFSQDPFSGFLPPLAEIRTVVEHMAKLSTIVGLSPTQYGTLKLEIGTEDVGVETVWENCHSGN